jgi:ribonuclease E
MSRKMLINAIHPEEARVAIVQDGRLMELDIEIAGSEQTRGNVYKGVVVRVEPALQAAFVDIGLKKLGFLQMGELHPDNWQWRDDIPEEQRKRRPRIQEVLRRGQELILQVEKGERDMKGAALTTYISLPGRCIVLMPGSDSAGISRKVEAEGERKKLKEAVGKLEIPEGMGYIVRTEAVGKTKTELTKDLQFQVKLYNEIQAKAKKVKAPALIYQETDLVTRTLRDYFTAEIDEILVDDPGVQKQIKAYFKTTSPKYEKLVKLHQEKRPIFSKYQLEEQIDHIYEKKVPLPSGGSIVIEPTEALVSIDVNSGKSSGEKGVEDTAFKTNLEAADEVARQLRLRDLGGLIVIDFIDMRDRKHINEVEKALKTALKADKARVTVGKISQFGIMEMSRQRIKQAIEQAVVLECPHCSGRGKVKSVESMALSFLRKVHGAAAKGTAAEVRGSLPLEVAYFLLNRKKRELAAIEDDYEIAVTIKGKPSFLMNQLELEVERREKPVHLNLPAEELMPVSQPAVEEDVAEEAAVPAGEQGAEEGAGKKKRKRNRKKKHADGTDQVVPSDVGDAEEVSVPTDLEADLVEEEPEAAEPGDEGAGEGKKKRRRRRRKKKGPAGGEDGMAAAAGADQPDDAAATAPDDVPEPTEAAGESTPGDGKKKRRRKRRKGKSSAEPSTADNGEESVVTPPVPVAAEVSGETPAPPKARRPAKKKAIAVPVDEPAPVVTAEPASPPEKKPRRPARSKVIAEPVPAVVAASPEAMVPAKKPRAKKVAAVANAPAPTPEAVAETAPPKAKRASRSRKKATEDGDA